MPDRTESPPSPPRPSARDERAERLAAELRTNLRRRKDQVRGRDALPTRESDDEPRQDR
jgi:hypothetical protein